MISQSNSYFKGRQKEMEYKGKKITIFNYEISEMFPMLNMVYPDNDNAAIFWQLLSRFSRFHLVK